MSYTRTLTADPGGAFPFAIETNSISAVLLAEDRRDIVVELSTEDGEDSEAGRAIDEAWAEMYARKYHLYVMNPNTSGIQVNEYGGVTITGGVARDMSVIGGRVYIDGHEVTPRRGAVSSGITALIRFPEYSPVSLLSTSGSFRIEGQIGHLDAELTSGNLVVNQASSTTTRMTSGTFSADAFYGDTNIRLSSGTLRIAYVNGPVDIEASSGNVDIGNIHGQGSITVTSGNLRVGGFDGSGLDLRASSGNINHPVDDRIKARVSSGLVNGQNPRHAGRGWGGRTGKGRW